MTVNVETPTWVPAGPMTVLGESPVWDSRNHTLTYVDILKGEIHSAQLGSGPPIVSRVAAMSTHVSFAVPASDGRHLVGAGPGFYLADFRRGRTAPTQWVARPIDGLGDRVRLNDVTTDAHGRLWAGTMPYDAAERIGALLRFDGDGQVLELGGRYGVLNGLGFSPDSSTMYWADTTTSTLFAAPFDLTSGEPGKPEVVRRFAPADGAPDGLCVTSDGSLLLAMWGSGRLMLLSPGGRVKATYAVPTPQPTKAAFVGEQLDRLAVTTASYGMNWATLESTASGHLLLGELEGLTGTSATPFRVG